MIPGPVVVVLLAPRMGSLAARFGQRALLVPGGLVYAAGGLWLLAQHDDAARLPHRHAARVAARPAWASAWSCPS